uniref:Uncharacterized protein n=1 Tax=Arundo donax TaxID=35708 RepID=A0A0A9DE29_ARUDO
MIMFTHSNWTAVSGAVPMIHAETKFTIRATILTVSWNCTNF